MSTPSQEFDLLTLAEAARLLKCSKAHFSHAVAGRVRGVIYGAVQYFDAFNSRHLTRFCYVYNPPTPVEPATSAVPCATHNNMRDYDDKNKLIDLPVK